MSIAHRVTLLLIPCLLLQSCSFFASSRQSISISSSPSGAKVVVNGESVGNTPVQTTIPRRDEAAILVSKDGYEPATRHTSSRLSGVGIVDVVGTFIFILPILGLISGGAWAQDPANISVTLDPVSAAK